MLHALTPRLCTLAVLFCFTVVSLDTEAGLSRRRGGGGSVAPAATGAYFLVSDTVSIGDNLGDLSLLQDVRFNLGSAPGINTIQGYGQECSQGFFLGSDGLPRNIECFWRLRPGELLDWQASIIGLGDGADLSFQWTLNMPGPDLTWDTAASETSFLDLVQEPDRPGRPDQCYRIPVGISGDCQIISLTTDLYPILDPGRYALRLEGTATAPTGKTFAFVDFQTGTQAGIVSSLSSTLAAPAFNTLDIIAVPLPNTLWLLGAGLTFVGWRRRQSRVG